MQSWVHAGPILLVQVVVEHRSWDQNMRAKTGISMFCKVYGNRWEYRFVREMHSVQYCAQFTEKIRQVDVLLAPEPPLVDAIRDPLQFRPLTSKWPAQQIAASEARMAEQIAASEARANTRTKELNAKLDKICGALNI